MLRRWRQPNLIPNALDIGAEDRGTLNACKACIIGAMFFPINTMMLNIRLLTVSPPMQPRSIIHEHQTITSMALTYL